MTPDIFTDLKIQQMIKFCSTGYDVWGKIIKRDVSNNYVAGRDRSIEGQIYWNHLNSEVSCILAIHSFLREYLTSKVPVSEISQLDSMKNSFLLTVVDYQRLCSTAHLTNNIDKKIEKNNALKKDRKINLGISTSSLASSIHDIPSKINGIVATILALKSLKQNLGAVDTSWSEHYRAVRRDFLAIASNIIGLFAPTAVGNTIIVAWMYSDIRDLKNFNKTALELSENKQKLLDAAGKFSGDTSIGDFYTYVLVTALAEHYGFSPNNGIKYNPQHPHLNMAKVIMG
ncbi:hypothetical protein ACJJIU_06065 [Microbulbifer sp. CnH-101-E]|uniref:hypothetical protein n=1 Tax=unclassified Microbulbifer TaxID=2619833 RepID=UPI004039C72A